MSERGSRFPQCLQDDEPAERCGSHCRSQQKSVHTLFFSFNNLRSWIFEKKT